MFLLNYIGKIKILGVLILLSHLGRKGAINFGNCSKSCIGKGEMILCMIPMSVAMSCQAEWVCVVLEQNVLIFIWMIHFVIESNFTGVRLKSQSISFCPIQELNLIHSDDIIFTLEMS